MMKEEPRLEHLMPEKVEITIYKNGNVVVSLDGKPVSGLSRVVLMADKNEPPLLQILQSSEAKEQPHVIRALDNFVFVGPELVQRWEP